MLIKQKNYLIICLTTLLSTFILWLPFILKFDSINGIKIPTPNFQTILKHWDGPLYIIPAKTLYNIDDSILKKAPLGLSEKYFSAHFPLYPLTIRLLSPVFGYPHAMIVSTLIASMILFCFFYYFLKKLQLTDRPLFLTLVFMFIMPRFLVIRSVGSPEPLFILLLLLSVFAFIKKSYLWAGLAGGLATMTKSPGILIFVGYVLCVLEEFFRDKKFNIKSLWLLLIPSGLLAVFLLYGQQYKDFFAYFHSGDNIHLIFPPFSVFNYQATWIGTAWLEEILFYFFFYLLTIFSIRNSPHVKKLFYFVLIFFIAVISVQHRDISRYSLPLLPFALIVFEKFFTSKKFLICLLLLLPAIYLYSWNFLIYNTAPIGDWAPFL